MYDKELAVEILNQQKLALSDLPLSKVLIKSQGTQSYQNILRLNGKK